MDSRAIETRRVPGVALGLFRACHPAPTVVVTAAVSVAAAALGFGVSGTLTVMVAVLVGQLSVGWANDARDAPADATAARRGKPTVSGSITVPLLWRAAVSAAIVCVPLSFLAAGPIGGTAHLIAVAVAWSYDLWLKATVWSFAPYMLAFAMVPPFLTYGLDPPRPPEPWAVVVLALVGLAAHLANGIPDVEIDRLTGSEGVVARVGVRAAAATTVVTLVVTTAILLSRLTVAPAAGATALVAVGVAASVVALASPERLFALVLVVGVGYAGLFWIVGGSFSGA